MQSPPPGRMMAYGSQVVGAYVTLISATELTEKRCVPSDGELVANPWPPYPWARFVFQNLSNRSSWGQTSPGEFSSCSARILVQCFFSIKSVLYHYREWEPRRGQRSSNSTSPAENTVPVSQLNFRTFPERNPRLGIFSETSP